MIFSDKTVPEFEESTNQKAITDKIQAHLIQGISLPYSPDHIFCRQMLLLDQQTRLVVQDATRPINMSKSYKYLNMLTSQYCKEKNQRYADVDETCKIKLEKRL